MMAFVSFHAAQRYRQRFAPHLTVEQAIGEIMRSASVIDRAAAFGAGAVKLANGARLILSGDVVVTAKCQHAAQPASPAMHKRWHKARCARDRGE